MNTVARWGSAAAVVLSLGCAAASEAAPVTPAAATAAQAGPSSERPSAVVPGFPKTMLGKMKVIRACLRDPNAKSAVTVNVDLEKDGSVSRCEGEAAEGLDPAELECILQAFRTEKYDPQPEPATLRVPIRFNNAGGRKSNPLAP